MKNLSKFIMAAVALTTMASCSDDLGIGSNRIKLSDADLVGTINVSDEVQTRAGMLETSEGRSFVWTKGDSVRVFTLDALTYHSYTLTGGENSTTGYFKNYDSSTLTGDMYAVTEAANVYAVSADENGKAQLTMTIDGTCKVSKTTASGGTVYQFPVPFWGEAEEATTSDGNKGLNVDFNALVAYLRIDVSQLPIGTKAIVLTTHGNPYLKQDESSATLAAADLDHGFQLLEPDATTGRPKAGFNYADTNAWWDAAAEEAGTTNTKPQAGVAPYITDGKSEALSGTLKATLEKESALAVDKRLVSSDTLRVNLNGITDQVFYLPVVAGTYENLHVLAVTQDSRYAYRWIGTELKHYQNKTFTVGKRSTLTLNLINHRRIDTNTLSYEIWKNGVNGRETVINVDTLLAFTSKTYDQGGDDKTVKNANGKYNNVGNWRLSPADLKPEYKNVYKKDTVIVKDQGNGLGKVIINIKAIDTVTDNIKLEAGNAYEKPLVFTDLEKTSAASKGTLVINVPEEWAAVAKKYIKVNLPTYNVVIGTVGGAPTKLVADVLGSADSWVSGHNLETNDGDILKDGEKAAIVVKNGISALNVLEGTKGDVYVYTADEETEIEDTLNVKTTEPIDVRITDALVKILTFGTSSDTRTVYTTGSAAIAKVNKYANNVAVGGEPVFPAKVTLNSYWTGSALTPYAIANGYDQKYVYTVAQLASVGENNTAEYVIPKILINHFWLGGEVYPWIGAKVTVKNFSIDGENTTLQNMWLETETGKDSTTPVYVNDPHYCCTSCGTPNIVGYLNTKTTELTSLGLIRSICEEGTATVKNIDLNDAYLNTSAAIDSIGAIVGGIKVTGNVLLEANKVGEVRIDAGGQFVGGQYGVIETEKGLVAKNNEVLGNKAGTGFIKSSKGYVGGLIGKAQLGGDKDTIMYNTVNLPQTVGEITAGADYVGGVVGYLNATSDNDVLVHANDVNVTKAISTSAKYAGGQIGQSIITSKRLLVRTGSVTTANINATNGYAGGVLGEASTGEVVFGTNNDSKIAKNSTISLDVDVDKISTAYAAGGIIGANNQESPVSVNTYANEDKGKYCEVNVEISAFENTKESSFFDNTTSDSNTQKCGTMSNIIGYKAGNLDILEAKLSVVDNLDSDMKEAVYYTMHPDRHYTNNEGVVVTENYWGDYNGYVGWGSTGYYKIDNKSQIQDVKHKGYNLYYEESEYNRDSKLVPVE